jgi:hypothetical protein
MTLPQLGIYKVPQLSNMFIFDPSTINLFIFFLTLLEGDIRMTWRWVNMPGTCGGGVGVLDRQPTKGSTRSR